MRCMLTTLATLALVAPAANAASVFMDEVSFNAAVTGNVVSSAFAGQPDGPITNGALFDNGIVITLDQPSDDNLVEGSFLRLSVDNTGSPATPASPLTETIELTFPVPVTAFAFEFGQPFTAPDGGTGRGIGNNSGTTLTSGGFVYDFVAEGFAATPGFVGFFGVVGHPGETFTSVVFSSNGIGDFTDDDFTIESISVAPVPVPAALPLLATGLGALAFMRRRRKG